ncbi:MAG: hypothetical protein U5K37_10810 [Natrialbaceae archaeon]|nr:hypothetical protein [Natrialbaceae archaeon]
MNRRTFVYGAAAVGSSSTAIIGSGAFSFVRADRDVTIEVVDDASAYLGLRPSSGPNGAYATVSNGMLGLDLSGSNPTQAGGSGLNDDAETLILDVFEIVNQGTQPVTVYYMSDAIGYEDNMPPAGVELLVSPDASNSFDLEVLNPYLLTTGDGPDPRMAYNPNMELAPGEVLSVGLSIDTDLTGDIDCNFTLHARAQSTYRGR